MQQWFRDVGAGRNIRRSAGLPVTLTRRFNRRAEEEEMRIVRRWAEREGIEIADHV